MRVKTTSGMAGAGGAVGGAESVLLSLLLLEKRRLLVVVAVAAFRDTECVVKAKQFEEPSKSRANPKHWETNLEGDILFLFCFFSNLDSFFLFDTERTIVRKRYLASK